MPANRPQPFRIMDCALTALALGRSAQNLRELRDHISQAPIQSISHHFYESLLRPTFNDPEYRNDFAVWASRQLHDPPLAERLAVIDPMHYEDVEALRQDLLDIVEDRLAEVQHVPWVPPGHEFHFLRSQLVVLDTGEIAETPEDLAHRIPNLTRGSIYLHFIDTRSRAPRLVDDFSAWLQLWGPAYDDLRACLAAVDYYLWSLTETRERIATCFASMRGEGQAS